MDLQKPNKEIETIADEIQQHFFALGTTVSKHDFDFVVQSLFSYRNNILEGVRKLVKECSDCKAQGVTEMVEVHISHLMNPQQTEDESIK